MRLMSLGLLGQKVACGACRPSFKPPCVSVRTMARMNSGAERRQQPLDLSGIYPPIPTPFDADGRMALDKLSHNLSLWEELDFSGYVLMGSNGEAPLLHIDEKVQLVRHVRAAAKSHKLLLAGAGAESTYDTIDLCRRLADAGADAALVITPCFYKASMTAEALKRHYLAVADASPLPVILYSVPANTGVDLAAPVVVELAKHPNIIALKDSGGDITKIGSIIGSVGLDVDGGGAPLQVLAGSAGFLLAALRLGAVGGVLAAANCMGGDCVSLYKMASSDSERCDSAAATMLQHKLIAPNAVVTRQLGVPALKYAMDKLGYYGGPVRSPLMELSDAEKQTVRTVFEKAGYRMNSSS